MVTENTRLTICNNSIQEMEHPNMSIQNRKQKNESEKVI